MSDDGPHLDILVEDEFSRFVADGLEPDVVVGAFTDTITLGIDSRDGTVDIFLGNLSPTDARTLASMLSEAADVVEETGVDGSSRTWVLGDESAGD